MNIDDLNTYMSTPKPNMVNNGALNTYINPPQQNSTLSNEANLTKKEEKTNSEPQKNQVNEKTSCPPPTIGAIENSTEPFSMLTNEEIARARQRQTDVAEKIMQGLPIEDKARQFSIVSLQENLATYIGEFVIIDFLIGTNMIVQKKGILFRVGISYLTLFEEDTRTFITCDFFSLKFVTFFLPGERPDENNSSGNNKTMPIPPTPPYAGGMKMIRK